MATQFFVNQDQDVISVIHRLMSASVREIILQIPPDAKIAKEAISLRILKRETQKMDKDIKVSSSDKRILKLAKEAGFKTIDKIPAADFEVPIKLNKLTPLGAIPQESNSFVDFISGPSNSSVNTDKIDSPAIAQIKQRSRRSNINNDLAKARSRMPITKIVYAFVAICVFLGLAAAYLILPRATVEVLPKSEIVNFDLEVVADPQVTQSDLVLNKIPGQMVKITQRKTQELDASQTVAVDSKAQGKITIYNNFSTQEQALVATTRFIPQGSQLIFRTKQKIIVPSAKMVNGKLEPASVEADIEADQFGLEYNIEPATWNIPGFAGSPKYEGFYAKSLTAMAGGNRKGEGKVASTEELSQAKEQVNAALQEDAQAELAKKIPSNLKFFDKCQRKELARIEVEKNPDNSGKFLVNGELQVEAVIFDLNDLKILIEKNVMTKISDQKKSLPESQIINYLDCEVDSENEYAKFRINTEERVGSLIDEVVLRRDLAGKNANDLQQYFTNNTAVDRVRVTFWPFWVKKAPNNPQSLKLKIVQALD